MKLVDKNKESPKNNLKNLLDKGNQINLSNLKFSKKNQYHQKGITGEDLPKNLNETINLKLIALGISVSLTALLVITYVINFFKAFLIAINQSKSGLLGLNFDSSFDIKYLQPIGELQQYVMISLVFITGITFLLYSKLNHESEKNLVYGQKGDSRFATIKEIQEQYFEIPENKKHFKGVGGVPVSHFKDKYYIDRDTVNTCVLGASRSGKGETFVVPMIDILSRASEQSNMVVNDPKGELFSASKETLEKRGYRVLVLNIDDPLQSMSFNPLQLVINAWANKDYHEASKRANTLTSMLFASGMGTDNEFFYKSAKSAVNAIILTIVEYCFEHDCIEKITMYNVAQMLNELGSLFYTDPKNPMKEKNALDEYFNNLPQGNQAKIQYGSTSFAGDKAKGSILSTASQGIEMFTSDLFGKLTSKMSIDLKEIGFPKYLEFKLNTALVGKRVNISFLRKKEGKVTVLKKYRVKVKALGLCVLNFDDKLASGDILEVKYEENNSKSRALFKLEIPKESSDHYTNDVYTKKYKSGKGFTDLELNDLKIKYTEKPTAVFMVIPDYDPSNHVIASIFISQLYTELATNCKETPGKKCFRRVHFLLDEFGNMPAIDNMDGIMTVCLGRNILFDLIIQSYSQLENRYNKGAQIIKENCQNHILIMSNDKDTIEEISQKCGNKTITGKSATAKHLDTDSSVTSSADQERIITPERASQLIEGEQVILRNLHRQDKDRKKIRPFPIFNTKETNMPYRYQFLNDDFDTRKDINEIDIECEHINLSLIDNLIPFASFIHDLKTRLEYSITNNIPISNEDFNAYRELPNSQQDLDEQALLALKENVSEKYTQETSENLQKEYQMLNVYIEEFKELLQETKEFFETIEKNVFIETTKKHLNNFIEEKTINSLLNEKTYFFEHLEEGKEKIKKLVTVIDNMLCLDEMKPVARQATRLIVPLRKILKLFKEGGKR